MKAPTFILFLILCFFVALELPAQVIESGRTVERSEAEVDTNYIQVFPGFLHGRLYFSQKYTNLEISSLEPELSLNYEPNTSLNFGVGATVKNFTLNLAYGFRFLNTEEGQGDTRYLDLQSRSYGRKWAIDLFGQFYNGLYLENSQDFRQEDSSAYYVRPDLKIRVLGAGALYVFNNRKFSYAAPFVQNEVQQKSAGSFLLGGDFSFGVTEADSSFFPHFLADTLFSELTGLRKSSFLELGPSLGYAYSLIIKKYFFITASLNITLAAGPVRLEFEDGSTQEEWQLDGGASLKFSIGYNSPGWYLGIMSVHDSFMTTDPGETTELIYGIGNGRINFVKRFQMGPKLSRTVEKLPL